LPEIFESRLASARYADLPSFGQEALGNFLSDTGGGAYDNGSFHLFGTKIVKSFYFERGDFPF